MTVKCPRRMPTKHGFDELKKTLAADKRNMIVCVMSCD
jgi:hypothetical protein